MRLASGQREEDLARARRQEPEHRLRRRRPREVRPRIAVLGLRQRRPGLLRPEPDPRRALGPRAGRRAVRRGDPDVKVGDPSDDDDRGRDAGQLQAARPGQGLHRDRARRGRDASSSAATRPTTRRWPMAPTSCRPSSTASTNDMRIAREEIFGPVVSIIPFDTEEEALRLANATPYGLSGSIWSRDIGKALRAAQGAPGRASSASTRTLGPHRGAVRRLQDVGHRARARDVRARPLHRDQERLHRPELAANRRWATSEHGLDPVGRSLRGPRSGSAAWLVGLVVVGRVVAMRRVRPRLRPRRSVTPSLDIAVADRDRPVTGARGPRPRPFAIASDRIGEDGLMGGIVFGTNWPPGAVTAEGPAPGPVRRARPARTRRDGVDPTSRAAPKSWS